MSHMMAAVLNTRQHASHVATQSGPGISLHRHTPVRSRKRRELETFGRTQAERVPHAEISVWYNPDSGCGTQHRQLVVRSLLPPSLGLHPPAICNDCARSTLHETLNLSFGKLIKNGRHLDFQCEPCFCACCLRPWFNSCTCLHWRTSHVDRVHV